MEDFKEPQLAEKKKALVIGVSDYDKLPASKQLPFCKNDGHAISDLLLKQGYKVPDERMLLGKVEGIRLKKAILDFFRKNAESSDTLLFYFSGHGIPDGFGNHFLASSDLDTELPEESGFSLQDLEAQMNKSEARKIVAVLDCCFSGAAGVKGGEQDAAKIARGAMERVFREGSGKCVLASSLGDQFSYKMKDQEFSRFTYFLLEGLRGAGGQSVNREGYVTPYTLSNYIYDRIPSLNEQKPITKIAMSGDIVIAYHPGLQQKGQLTSKEISDVLTAGRDYFENNNDEKALDCFRRVLEIDRTNISALANIGNVLVKQEKYEDAVTQYDRACLLDQNDPILWYNRANALLRQGKYEDAVTSYDKAIQLQPNDADSLHNKGIALKRMGKKNDAEATFYKERQLNKSSQPPS